MSTAFDPYYTWLGIRPEEQPPNHYRLLALQAFEDNLDTIEHAADQRMAHLRTLQSGKQSVFCQKLLNEVATAKICLLNAEKKAAYDEMLRVWLASRTHGQVETPVAVGSAEAVSSGQFAAVGSGVAVPRPRPSATQRHKTMGPAAAVIAVGLVVIVGLIVWGVSQNNPPGGRAGVTAQTPSDRARTASEPPEREKSPEKPSQKTAPPTRPTPNPDPAAAKKTAVAVDPRVPPDAPGKEDNPVEPKIPGPGDAGVGKEPAETLKKTPVPSAAEQDAIVQKLEKLYGLSQLKTATEKLKVAGQLFELAKKSTQNPAEQFTLLRKATELAVEGNDALGVAQAIDALAAVFEFDALAAKERAMVKIAEKGTGAERLKWLVEQARIVLDQAQAEKRYDVAMRLAAAVKAACQSSRDFRKETNERYLAVQAMYKQWEVMQQAKAALEKDPADADANLVLGRWYCFQEDDWERGLPYLAKGSDPGLKAVAALEIASPTDAEQQLAVANAWWDLAAKAGGDDKTPLLRRAGRWYGETKGKLTSTIAAAENEQRLKQINEYLTPADESPAPKSGGKTGDPPAKPGDKKELSPRDVVKLFGLQKPKWAIDGETLVGQLGRISDPTNNPALLKVRRGTSLDFHFKIQSRWYQVIHVFIDGQRYSCSRGHNGGAATVITVAGVDERARWWQRVASETEWCELRATLKDGKLTFFYNGEEQWSGTIPDVKGGRHGLSVGFASNVTTVKIKDVYLEIE
jgi:hypothetical protein